MKFSKIISVGLMLAMAGMLVVSAPAARAQSTADLNAQIQMLLAQIAQLQAQMNGSTGGSSTSCTTFTRSLTIGSTGSDVKALQMFLNSHNAVIAASGAGSMGNESTYFGGLTKAALAKFQAAQGISPAVGYFGPLTMAKVNSMCTTTGGGPVGGGTPVPGAGLSVGLSSQNPGAGSLISSGSSAAARVPVLAVNFTAGTASGVTVSDVSFTKNGVLSDSSISGAYLVENGKVLAQYNSVSMGKVNFSNLGLSIAAGQTRTLWLAIDPAAGLSAGNTVSFSLASASDVKAWDANNAAINVSGVLPASGNIFTVTSVSNPSLATFSLSSSSIGTEVTAGTNDNVVGAWNFTIGNSKVWLKGINFKVIGSANKNDLRNVKLYVNGTQVGSALSSVAADGTAYFDLGSSAASLNTGSNSVQVHADIAGSPSYTFQFELLNSYDILAVDSQYNVPITAGSNTGTLVSIKTGSITLQVASDTPTGNISAGQSGVTLAKFTFYAAGEAVKIKWLGWGLNITGATTTIDNLFRNVSLVDDAGSQVGNTVNTLSSTNTCTDTAYSNSTSSYRNCFGSSGSPINYIVPANTTRTLYLKADIQSGASFSTVVGLITSNSSNLQGLTSSQTASTGAANGSALSFSSSALTIAKNAGVGTQTLTANSSGRRIGSYTLTASSAEGVNVSTVTILTGAAGSQFQNLMVKVNGTQFGSTQSTLSNSTSYTFSGTQFSVPKGQSVTLDVYADILSSASVGTKSVITTLSGCSANGATSFSSISCTSTAGQDVVIAGQATISITADSGQSSDQIVMGTTGATLASFRVTETSNVEDVKVTDLIIFQQVGSTSSVKSAFNNVKLYKTDGTLLGTAGGTNTSVGATNPGRGYYYKFNFASPIVVPQSNSVSLVLKGDVSSYTSSGATDNTTHVFKIASSTDTDNDTLAGETVVALGATSNASSAVSLGAATGPTKTVLRSKLTFSSTQLATVLTRSSAVNLASLTFAADSAGSVAVNSVTVTFSGTAASIATFLDGVTLLDESNNTLGTANTTSSACNGSNTCSITFNLGSTTGGQIVTGGTSRTWTLRVDGTKLQAAAASVSRDLSATINARTDIQYTDALDSAAATAIGLASNVIVPIQLSSVSTSNGG
jgi:Putative peptidoglycan binding domain